MNLLYHDVITYFCRKNIFSVKTPAVFSVFKNLNNDDMMMTRIPTSIVIISILLGFNLARAFTNFQKFSFKLQKTKNGFVRDPLKQLSIQSGAQPIDFNIEHSHNLILRENNNIIKRSVTGGLLAILGTSWIYYGKLPFLLGFMVIALVSLREFQSMLKALEIPHSIVCSLLTIIPLILSVFPQYHQYSIPLTTTLLLVYYILFQRDLPTIKEISTSLLAIVYFGYFPSFWVLLRNANHNTMKLFGVSCEFGALLVWWTWACIVATGILLLSHFYENIYIFLHFVDVGGFFVGKLFGRHKLSELGNAAGIISPKKTIEGALAGFFFSGLTGFGAAYWMRWPLGPLSGVCYGLAISFVAIIGDLSISMLKRDAKIKDSGTILPGHGGVLDRFDSYIFTAPLALLLCSKLFRGLSLN